MADSRFADHGITAVKDLAYSIVVPVYNESAVVSELHTRITKVMEEVGKPFEIVFVDDGSTDATGPELEAIVGNDARVMVLSLRRNFGQTSALQAGFDFARGEVVVAMDGDLQHDPAEIPLLLTKIDEGFDIASGWRVSREGEPFHRRIPSRVANWLLARVSGVELHDFGTTFKAYRRDVLQDVRLYGDMHRYVPAICARMGARIAEVPISNAPRTAGQSSYGISRTLPVALDLLTLRFLTVYLTRPLHLFGKWGVTFGGMGSAILAYGFLWKVVMSFRVGWDGAELFSAHAPLMMIGFMLVALGLIITATGLIGEIQMRSYFESTGQKTYAIKRIIQRDST